MSSNMSIKSTIRKTDDAVESYRNYYNGAKKDFAKWKNRDIPEWFNPASTVASDQQVVLV